MKSLLFYSKPVFFEKQTHLETRAKALPLDKVHGKTLKGGKIELNFETNGSAFKLDITRTTTTAELAKFLITTDIDFGSAGKPNKQTMRLLMSSGVPQLKAIATKLMNEARFKVKQLAYPAGTVLGKGKEVPTKERYKTLLALLNGRSSVSPIFGIFQPEVIKRSDGIVLTDDAKSPTWILKIKPNNSVRSMGSTKPPKEAYGIFRRFRAVTYPAHNLYTKRHTTIKEYQSKESGEN